MDDSSVSHTATLAVLLPKGPGWYFSEGCGDIRCHHAVFAEGLGPNTLCVSVQVSDSVLTVDPGELDMQRVGTASGQSPGPVRPGVRVSVSGCSGR